MCLILDLRSLPQFVTVSLTCSVTLAPPSNKLLPLPKTGNIITSMHKGRMNMTVSQQWCLMRCTLQNQIIKMITITDIVKSAWKLTVSEMDSGQHSFFLFSPQASVTSSRGDANSLPHTELARASLCLSHSQKHFYQTGSGWRASDTGH